MKMSLVVDGLRSDVIAVGDLGDDAVRAQMQKILEDIRSGAFAEEWIAENKAGRPNFTALREAGKAHQIETVGAELRAMMPFISAGKTRVQDASGG